MNHDPTFRAVLIVVFLLVLPIGIYHRLKSQATREKLDRWQEGLFILATLRPVGMAFWLGLIAWMVFLGVSVVLRRDEHVRIEFVELRVSGVPRRIVYLAADVILLTFLIVASITSALLTISTFEREAMLAATGLPVGVIYASMPVGFGFSALNALERLLLRLSGRDLPQHSDRLVASTSQIAAAAEAGDETIVR